MSCLTKSQFEYLSNDGRGKFYEIGDGDGEDNNFDFQYVPVDEFKHIIKDVRRQRDRDEDERIWSSFLIEQEQQALNHELCYEAKCKSTRTLAQSLEEVDRELMRLEADALPETNYHIGSISARDCQGIQCSTKSTKKNSPTTKENGTGSTNFLLTIPEEENICCMTESSEPCRTFIRKSCSDQTFKNHRIRSRCYHYSANDLDYNSSPDISPDRYSDDIESIPVHPDPIAVTKILSLQRKISTVLDSISYELDRIPLPDGENDLIRRRQRVVEFSTRLSRNYLYDLGRQITNIQRHINSINPDCKMRLTRRGIILHMQAIEQKLISTHQLLLAALSAYWKHIPSSVLRNDPGKLKEILQIVVQLKNICNEIKLTPDLYCSGDERDAFLGKETENRCSAILSKFRSTSDNESQVPSHTTRSTVITPSRSRKQRNRKQLASRLSMYTMDMRLAKNIQPRKAFSMYQLPRDKKISCMALKNQQSNISTSKKSNITSSIKARNETTRSKVTKINIPVKEDDIQTMMETVPSDLESPKSIKSSKRSEIHSKLHRTIDIYGNTKESERLKKSQINDDEVSKTNHSKEKCFSSLLPVIGDLLSLVQNQNKQSNTKSLPADSIDALQNYIQQCQSKVSIDEHHSYQKVQDKIEIGTKNMRLICYSTQKEEDEGKLADTRGHKEITKFNDASCQAHSLRSSGTLKLSVPESTALCFNEYRNQYLNSLKTNPMYTSNTQNKPWDIVPWIADKLVEELIIELADDFQMEDIIQKLFDLEFQEF